MRFCVRTLCAVLLGVALRTQAPALNVNGQDPAAQTALVPLKDEPHHHLVLQNAFVRVYSVGVPPLDVTLLHQHDLPYLGVSLGPTDILNSVRGKPAARLKLQDGDVIYSPGGFAHFVATDSGVAFNNVTVEFLLPQGTARNICKQVVAGPAGACPQRETPGKKTVAGAADDGVPYFETDEIRVDLFKVALGRDYVDAAPKRNALLVALTDANLDVNLGGEHISFLHAGDVLWLPAGTHRKVMDFLGTQSRFLLISFQENAAKSATP